MDKAALRRLLFEKDKQQSMNGGVPSKPASISTSFPSQNIVGPHNTSNIGVLHPTNTPHPAVPSLGTIKPTSIPSLPALPKSPRFAKTKKILKPTKFE